MVINLKKFINVQLSVVFASVGADTANSASFNCDAAASQAELAICGSERLSQLDTLIDQQWQSLDRLTKQASITCFLFASPSQVLRHASNPFAGD